MIAGIEIAHWLVEGRGTEAARLVPRQAVCASVDWPLAANDSEGSIRPDVVAALSRALAACGSVAFRRDAPLAGAVLHQPSPARSVLGRFLEAAGLGEDRFGLAIASDPAVVGALFA